MTVQNVGVGASVATGTWGFLTTVLQFPPVVASAVAGLTGLFGVGQSIKSKWDIDRDQRYNRKADDQSED